MAGRPKMMANKITDLAEKMEELFSLIEKYIPEQYEMWEGPLEKAGELCQCWNMAVFKVTDAMSATSSLAEMLRAKAGIDEAEHRAARRAERAKTTEQRENPQAVPCCGQGTSGEPMGGLIFQAQANK